MRDAIASLHGCWTRRGLEAMAKAKKYNHAYTIAFELESDDEYALDVTPAMFRSALLKRVADMPDSEWRDACNLFDSNEVEGAEDE